LINLIRQKTSQGCTRGEQKGYDGGEDVLLHCPKIKKPHKSGAYSSLYSVGEFIPQSGVIESQNRFSVYKVSRGTLNVFEGVLA